MIGYGAKSRFFRTAGAAQRISAFARSSALGLGLAAAGSVADGAGAAERSVRTPAELAAAVSQANPGDVITLQPGTYRFSSRKIRVTRPGTATARITVRAAHPASTVLQSGILELFSVEAPYWTFDGLQVEGVCATHSACEHAFHIVGRAHHTIIRNSTLRDFNAQIKGNGLTVDGVRIKPDDVIIEDSKLYNRTPRKTSNPVTAIDVVEGSGWIVRRNYIADSAKSGGNYTSYLAFFKGGGGNGLFEGNLLVGSLNHTGGVRLGLSFGGGGSPPAYGIYEHTGGVMRNNILMNFSDAAIYLNEAPQSRIYNNLIYNSGIGIDVRFTSTASIANNVVSGPIMNRDGGQSTVTASLANVTNAMFDAWFVSPAGADFRLEDGAPILDKGAAIPDVVRDFCDDARPIGPTDIGPIEYGAGRSCPIMIKALHRSLLGANMPGGDLGSEDPGKRQDRDRRAASGPATITLVSLAVLGVLSYGCWCRTRGTAEGAARAGDSTPQSEGD